VHPKSQHLSPYNFDLLVKVVPQLKPLVFKNEHGTETIDFSNPEAVLLLNKALLAHHYGITDWHLPAGYLCPPIPGRVDYIHHIADLLKTSKKCKGLDIGTGANAIYTLLGHATYQWDMVGTDIQKASVEIAKANTALYAKHIDIRHQMDNAHLFKGVVYEGEYFDFTVCNPPFYASAKEAERANTIKAIHLGQKEASRNFGGQANELWCNGGEALFIKRLIKESVHFKDQVGWFTALVSRKQHLPKIYKQLDKLKASHKTIDMSQGNKQSRFVAWTF